MDRYAFRTDGARKCTEVAEDIRRVGGVDAERCELRAYRGANRCGSLLHDKSFSLTIRADADDGRILLETRVEYMHQAFQTLIDWSITEGGYDVSAAISGPDDFHMSHRIKDSGDFSWIESD